MHIYTLLRNSISNKKIMIIQKKADFEITFDFKESILSYKLKNSSWTNTIKANYTEINIQDIDELVEQNNWLKNVWILWICIWLVFHFLANENNSWTLIWLICLVTFYFRQIKFSSLSSSQWTILVIQDKKHQEILDIIKEKKRGILREKLFFYDPNNDQEVELQKYEFLRDEWAINEEEYSEINQQLFKKISN